MYFRQWLEAVEDERYAFKAVFMAGGPGSGKSFLAQKIFPDFNQANSDNIQVLMSKMVSRETLGSEMRSRSRKYDNRARLTPNSPTFHSDLARAQRLNANRCEFWTKQGYPVVIDITSRDPNLVSSINRKLKSYGYDTGMIFVHSSLSKAIERNKKRGLEGKHVAEESFLKDAWEKAYANIPIYRKMFDDKFQEVNNENEYGLLDRRNRMQFDRQINQVMGRILTPVLSRKEIIRRKESLCNSQQT